MRNSEVVNVASNNGMTDSETGTVPKTTAPVQDGSKPKKKKKVKDHRYIHLNRSGKNDVAAHQDSAPELRIPNDKHKACRTCHPEGDKFCSNYISTQKYTVFNFLPKNLMEQFQKKANFYFLIIAIISLSPLSPKTWVVSVMPLVLVLGASALKEGIEDYNRFKQDRDINGRMVSTWSGSAFEDKLWADLAVGEVVYMTQDSYIPADVLILKTSHEQGTVAIETANLDGETNLKIKKAVPGTYKRECKPDGSNFGSVFPSVIVQSSAPSKEMDFGSWTGNLRFAEPYSVVKDKQDPEAPDEVEVEFPSSTVPLTMDSLVLRGCKIRNTKWVIGFVLFTGNQTKFMLNNKRARFKRSRVDLIVDQALYALFLLQFVVCTAGALANSAWISANYLQHWYLPYNVENTKEEDISSEAGLSWLTYLVLVDIFIPISLYVSIEVVKFAQAFLINWDQDMYAEEIDAPATARTSNLNEELGQISYIFTDKTGTLTGNKMDFCQCAVNGMLYGQPPGEGREDVKAPEYDPTSKPAMPEGLPGYDADANFDDPRLLLALEGKSESDAAKQDVIHHFLLGMALNHTVMCDYGECEQAHEHSYKTCGPSTYQAASPDEKALLIAARNQQYFFYHSEPATFALTKNGLQEVDSDAKQSDDTVVVNGERYYLNIRGEDVVFELLEIFAFNSTRARMSVIIRDPAADGKLTLYCKGSDTMLLKLLTEDSKSSDWSQLDAHLTTFAQEGLRTLVFAKKDLDVETFVPWMQAHAAAKAAVDNRKALIAASQALVEADLTLLGATAIEDKLQVGVPKTIATLARANIKIWMLTGDKTETAINIGISCSLVNPKMLERGILRLTVDDHLDDEAAREQTMQRLNEIYEEIRDCPLGSDDLCVVINGRAAGFIFHRATVDPITGKKLKAKDVDEAMLAADEAIKRKLLDICLRCKAVICCRTSPSQKSELVKLVKDRIDDAITLAIGDGANDVSMIKSAHVGVGIVGLEGLQAAMASDYSIGQFRFLAKLLLVHGYWNYSRVSTLILYSFYKNVCISFVQVWFACQSGFSAQMFYDAYAGSAYNILFTSMPILFAAFFNQDLSKDAALQNPELYTRGQKNELFSLKVLFVNIIEATLQSIVLYFSAFWCMDGVASANGLVSDHWVVSTTFYSNMVLLANYRIALDTNYFTWINVFFIIASVLVWFMFALVYSSILSITPDMYHVAQFTYTTWQFWLQYLLIPLVCVLPTICIRYYKRMYNPTVKDILQEIDRGYTDGKNIARVTPVDKEGQQVSELSSKHNEAAAPPKMDIELSKTKEH